MQEIQVPVLIVGGSLVGLSTAMLLGQYGVPSLAVEHHPGTAIHPRAAQISQRTMEILRAAGIEGTVRAKSEEQFVQDGAIMAVESLAGKEITYYIANLNEGVRDYSPCERVFISQSLLEPILKQRAEALGADLRFGTDLTSFEQDAEGVTAIVQPRAQSGNGGEPTRVRAQYMVAADGATSRIREQLGIRMAGHGSFSKSVTIYFRADVRELFRGRNLSVVYILNQHLRGFMRMERPFETGFLAVNAIGDPAQPITDVATGLTEERARELIYSALGTRDIEVTIENTMPWEACADVAGRFQEGRVFLAGDAAHVMPPNGGFGGNTGVQDAHNLAWKLAWVLRGDAGEGLLATYEMERRPASAFTVEQAYTRYVMRTAPYLGTQGVQPLEHDLNVEFGYIYRSPAVIVDVPNDVLHEHPQESLGRPGSRAPHIWLSEGESTLDKYGRAFVLMAGGTGEAWIDAAAKLPIEAHLVDRPGFAALHGIGTSGAVLVRPDGFVGWRAKTDEGASAKTLSTVLSTLTCKQ